MPHEIGHYIERTDVADDPEYSFADLRTPSSYDLHEFFADEFAGAFLMPEDEIVAMLNKEDATLIGIAEQFGVLVPAVKRRRNRLRKHGAAV